MTEGVVVAAPAVFLAPILASAVVTLTTDGQWLAGVGPWLWAVSGAIGVAGVLALSLVLARSTTKIQSNSGSGSLRLGLDLLVALLAILAAWQLWRSDGAIASQLDGSAAVDPLIIAAPALILLTGALLALRLLLWGARGFDNATKRSPSIGSPLGIWQVSRRPSRQIGPALLLVLAFGVGTLALTYNHSWSAAQAAQADIAAGAALTIGANPQRQSPAIPGQLDAIDGVEDVMAVLTATPRPGRMLALDAAVAPRMITMRPDMITTHPSLLAAATELLEARPYAPGIPLPDGTTELRFDLQLQGLPADDLDIWVVLRDSTGVLHRPFRGTIVPGNPSQSGLPASDAIALTTSIPLGRTAEGTWGAPVDGAELLAVEIAVNGAAELRLQMQAFTIAADGSAAPLTPPEAWRGRVQPPPDEFVITDIDGNPISQALPVLQEVSSEYLNLASGDNFLNLRVSGPAGGAPRLALLPSETGVMGTGAITLAPAIIEVPALATFDQPVQTNVAAQSVTWLPVGHITALPGLGLDDLWRQGFMADLPTLMFRVWEASGNIAIVDGFWVTPQADHIDQTVAALNASPFGPVTTDRDALEAAWQEDPLGLSVVDAMRLALGAAALFAVAGLALAAIVALRERRAELAVLQALGTSPQQITGSVVVEHAFLLITGIGLGGVLGAALAHVLLPRFVRDVRGVPPVPPVETLIPWMQLVIFVALITGATAVAVVLVVRTLLRTSIVDTLRSQELR
jgi:hypothetical protein